MSLLLVESSSVGHTTIFVTARKAIPLAHEYDLTFLSGHTVRWTLRAGFSCNEISCNEISCDE